MRKFKAMIISLLILFFLWIMLTGFSIDELIIGFISVLIIVVIFKDKTEVFKAVKLSPKALFYMTIYSFVFLGELIKSNIDVAFRVLSPTLPINPGIVKVKTKLKSKMGRIFLANSITLTPGTLTVETDEEHLYIHWIDVSSKNIEDATNKIVSKFEKYLEVIFG